MQKLPYAPGIGLKAEHYEDVLNHCDASGETTIPAWAEIHPQNYVMAGGPAHRWLRAIADKLPLSFHSVGLSLGSADGVIAHELDALAELCTRYEPASVSEHLSWSGSDTQLYPDLLPMPYTPESLAHFAAQISKVQDRLQRQILIENPSRYLAFADDTMDEAEFLNSLARQSGCGLLLDINNIEVSATNLGLDPNAMIDGIASEFVQEIHLAGHKREDYEDGPLLIDDHGSPVTDETWRLFSRFLNTAGPRPVLIEWDTDVPTFEVLIAECAKAQARMPLTDSGDGRGH